MGSEFKTIKNLPINGLEARYPVISKAVCVQTEYKFEEMFELNLLAWE